MRNKKTIFFILFIFIFAISCQNETTSSVKSDYEVVPEIPPTVNPDGSKIYYITTPSITIGTQTSTDWEVAVDYNGNVLGVIVSDDSTQANTKEVEINNKTIKVLPLDYAWAIIIQDKALYFSPEYYYLADRKEYRRAYFVDNGSGLKVDMHGRRPYEKETYGIIKKYLGASVVLVPRINVSGSMEAKYTIAGIYKTEFSDTQEIYDSQEYDDRTQNAGHQQYLIHRTDKTVNSKYAMYGPYSAANYIYTRGQSGLDAYKDKVDEKLGRFSTTHLQRGWYFNNYRDNEKPN